MLVPLKHKLGWAFTNKGLKSQFNPEQAYGISLSRLNTLSKEWQAMFKIDRQFNESVLSVALFASWIQGGPTWNLVHGGAQFLKTYETQNYIRFYGKIDLN